MNEHDPMCPKRGLHPADEAMMAVVVQCRCEEYARVRADERERIVAELEGPVRESEAMYAHAEAVAAKLVEVIRVDDLRLRTQKGHTAQARRERDAARAEVERLRSPEWEAEVRADERERVEKVLTEAWGAAKASWRSGGDTYWEGRMDALDYAIRIAGGEQP